MAYNKEKRNVAADFLQRYVDDKFTERVFLGGSEHRIPGADMVELTPVDTLYPTPVLEEPNYPGITEQVKPINWI